MSMLAEIGGGCELIKPPETLSSKPGYSSEGLARRSRGGDPPVRRWTGIAARVSV